MGYDFVFVHGTGVREPAYTSAFDRISEQLKSRRDGVRVHRCYWGADYGTRLYANGTRVKLSGKCQCRLEKITLRS